MHVERLRLSDFRNYRDLDVALPAGLIVLQGRNAQGKSNILEAIGLVATSRSFRTNSEREVVRWGAPAHFARVEAAIKRRSDAVTVDVLVSDAGAATPAGTETPAVTIPPPPGAPFRKRIRINGVAHRAMDLLGQVTVVTFSPTDLDLVIGSPAERRRFLDLTLCQVHPAYCRALSQYQKVIAQRAALLRRIREGEEGPHALTYWDEQLAQLAAPIMLHRAAFLGQAEAAAARIYATLTADASGEDEATGGATGGEVPEAGDAQGSYGRELEERGLQVIYRPSYAGSLSGSSAEVSAGIRARLLDLRRRELAQGVNVLGPHRDDIAFLAGDVDLSVYGSRGQQRTVALALKLAELEYIETETGEQPILLLDDVLSELDAQRRRDLLAAVRDLDQVLLTVADAASVPAEARERAHIYAIRGGRVIPRSSPSGP
jgi:DNA replication and repair protein RecF